MKATKGLTAPDGYLWCRGPRGPWHFLRAAELVHRGERRSTARSVCGLWASLLPEEQGWTEVVQRVTPEPRRMCERCLLAVGEAQRRVRLVAPEKAQPKLF